MSSPTNGTQKKPKQRTLLRIRKRPTTATCLRCECTEVEHAKPSHALECDCEGFQPRPCECGHPHSAHGTNGVCTGKLDTAEAKRQRKEVGGKCGCKSYRSDRTPAFLLRDGIGSGEWQFLAVPQLRKLMEPRGPFGGFGLKTRVWACGMLHTIGLGAETGRPRMAMRFTGFDERRNPVFEPLSPHDIVVELNEVDPLGRATDQSVRRALAELEQHGVARRVGKRRMEVRLFFYYAPSAGNSSPRMTRIC